MNNPIKDTVYTICDNAIQELYQVQFESLEIQNTKEEFTGDYTLVVFPLLKQIKGNPAQIAESIGQYLKVNSIEVSDFNVIKGFLNLVLEDSFLLSESDTMQKANDFGKGELKAKKYMVEFSSPNTNKPLHLGHMRNILLGSSLTDILRFAGYPSMSTQIINDRGIHISKSMVAWKQFGNGQTPESTQTKGDHFVGDFYVKFDQVYQAQIKELMENGKTDKEAKAEAPIMQEAREMLQKWENNDPDTLELWRMMNGWVYQGFNETYARLGVNFDSVYYESNTYLLGKDLIAEGLEKGDFFEKEDGSVWVDLSEEGLDEKLVLRSDGTAVYMTQDIGTAVERFKENDIDAMVYTVGNEQDYHFKVLFLILDKLGYEWANDLSHLSYGMVELPEGKMKSREGTVVDADDLLDTMHQTAKDITEELGKIDDYENEEKEELYESIGQSALKYYILKVDPKKGILFNPEESIEFTGNTGPFIQYTYARIQSLLSKADEDFMIQKVNLESLHDSQRNLILLHSEFPEVIQKSAIQQSPALVANYMYELAKAYNSMYQDTPILKAKQETDKLIGLKLSNLTAEILKKGLNLLGINAPQRM